MPTLDLSQRKRRSIGVGDRWKEIDRDEEEAEEEEEEQWRQSSQEIEESFITLQLLADLTIDSKLFNEWLSRPDEVTNIPLFNFISFVCSADLETKWTVEFVCCC